MSANDKFIPFISADSGERYELVIFVDGTIACNCGDFVHRRRLGRDECKHIEAWKRDNIRPGKAGRGRVLDNPADFR